MDRSIVINREYGSGGREIGRRICEQTGMQFYDTRILQDTASRRGLPAHALESFDEHLGAGQALDLSGYSRSGVGTMAVPYVLYSAVTDVITEAAEAAPAVFIGRCADIILRKAGLPLLSVFVYNTNKEQKTARAARVDGVDPREADRFIAQMDRMRARYQQFFTNTRFGDYHLYDLCLNSADLGYSASVELVLSAARAADRQPGPRA